MTGTILQLQTDRGFGYVRGADRTIYFFHMSGCRAAFANLRTGDQVEYDEEPSDRGPRACNVRLAGAA